MTAAQNAQSIPQVPLAVLASHGVTRSFAPGEDLMRQGDVSDVLHIVLSGRVRVVREHEELVGPLVLAELSAGSLVGEMGVLDGEPRSATVTAIEPTETREVPATTVMAVMKDQPQLADALLRLVSRRLRHTDSMVEQARLELVALVADHLRTPLTSVRGYVSLLLGGELGVLLPQQEEALETVSRNVERLNDAVDRVVGAFDSHGGVLSAAWRPLESSNAGPLPDFAATGL
jgi:CRP/FNR family transcriptional regulator, cyclic AMP receptor protein